MKTYYARPVLKQSLSTTVGDAEAVPRRGRAREPSPHRGSKTPTGRAALDAILADITAGEPAYRAAQAHGIPMGTFWRWLAHDGKLMEKYMRAKKVGLERYAEDILQVADDLTVLPEHKRLMIDSRKWLLSKLLPKSSATRGHRTQ